jgi:hypothetical protein
MTSEMEQAMMTYLDDDDDDNDQIFFYNTI